MLRVEAEERAEPSSYALVRLHLCELELRIGALGEAQRLLDDWGASADNRLLHWPMYERCQALLAVGRGDADGARHWATAALDRAETAGVRWDQLETERALGLVALLEKDPAKAVEHLGAVWDHTEREGVEDPGAFPVAPDLVEALVETDALDRARSVASRLAALALAQDHPWALAGSQRSAAMIELAAAYDDQPADSLEEAAATYRDLGLAFDEARTLLVLGRARRRARKWGSGPEHPRGRGEGLRRDRVARLGRRGASRADASGRPAAHVPRSAHRHRAPGRRPGGRRTLEQGDRQGPGRDGQHRGVPPPQHLRQARHPVPHAPRRSPPGRGRRPTEPEGQDLGWTAPFPRVFRSFGATVPTGTVEPCQSFSSSCTSPTTATAPHVSTSSAPSAPLPT